MGSQRPQKPLLADRLLTQRPLAWEVERSCPCPRTQPETAWQHRRGRPLSHFVLGHWHASDAGWDCRVDLGPGGELRGWVVNAGRCTRNKRIATVGKNGGGLFNVEGPRASLGATPALSRWPAGWGFNHDPERPPQLERSGGF